VGNREESILAAENGATGIGLLRLEFLMMSFEEMPNERTLAGQLRSVLEPFRRAAVTVRLLDAGGDKTIPWLDLPRECNPSLGRRGVRVLLDRPDLLDLQLRVLLRLAEEYEDLRILVPMVTLSEEIRRVHDRLARVASDMRVDRTPPLGAMIETPAAALCVDEIIECSDFLSIGTNDLTQYTMAADRESAAASYYFQDGHPAVLKLVRMVCDRAADLPVWLCGELAGRVESLPTLLELGVRNLSVAPPLVPAIKEAVRESSISSAEMVRDGLASKWARVSERA
jgi:phosphotransferase system enzyme I (PtsI)